MNFDAAVRHRLVFHLHPVADLRKDFVLFYININTGRPDAKVKLTVRSLITGKGALVLLKEQSLLSSLLLS